MEPLHRPLCGVPHPPQPRVSEGETEERSLPRVGLLVHRHQLCRGDRLGMGAGGAGDRRPSGRRVSRSHGDPRDRRGRDGGLWPLSAGVLRVVSSGDTSLPVRQRQCSKSARARDPSAGVDFHFRRRRPRGHDQSIVQAARRLAHPDPAAGSRPADAKGNRGAPEEIAEKANLAKSSFLAAASHDLRQPVHALGIFVGALRGIALPPEGRRIVEQIEASTTAMDGLFSALLDISRLDARVVAVQRRAFAIGPLLDRICRDHREEATAKGVWLLFANRPPPSLRPIRC